MRRPNGSIIAGVDLAGKAGEEFMSTTLDALTRADRQAAPQCNPRAHLSIAGMAGNRNRPNS
jgi:hypothetical protein